MNSFKRILIVDDSRFDRELLAKALAHKGKFELLEAASGEECLNTLASEVVHLILMDVMMPKSCGTDALDKIRETFNQIELPVIMVTSKADNAVVVSALQRGANDYITKPVNFDVALSRIMTHLKLAEVSREMARLKELSALDAMITTYNHEINNPLTIALGFLQNKAWKQDAASEEMLEKSLWRIADIVRKITSAVEKKDLEYEEYGSKRMIKVR